MIRRAMLLMVLGALVSCEPEPAPVRFMGNGDADSGREAIRRFECGACHVIPGVRGARGRAGPSLEDFAQRVYLAGNWPNEPGMLVRFLRDPPAFSPHTLMPAVGMDEATARDMAAYLYSLE
jgi:cytochrome c2